MPVPAPPVGGGLATDISRGLAGFISGREEKRRQLFEEALKTTAQEQQQTLVEQGQQRLDLQGEQLGLQRESEESRRAEAAVAAEQGQQRIDIAQEQSDRQAAQMAIENRARQDHVERNLDYINRLRMEQGLPRISPEEADDMRANASIASIEAQIARLVGERESQALAKFRNTQLRVADVERRDNSIRELSSELMRAKREMAQLMAKNMGELQRLSIQFNEEDPRKLMSMIAEPQDTFIKEIQSQLATLYAEQDRAMEEIAQMNPGAYPVQPKTEAQRIQEANEKAESQYQGPGHWDTLSSENKQTLSDDLHMRAIEALNTDQSLATDVVRLWEFIDAQEPEDPPAYNMYIRGRIPTLLLQNAISQWTLGQQGQVTADPAGSGLPAGQAGVGAIPVSETADPNSGVVIPGLTQPNEPVLPDPNMLEAADTTGPRRPGSMPKTPPIDKLQGQPESVLLP
jgi:hypothetical protein